MTEYQRITLKESGEEFLVDTMEYPYAQAGILYIKFIRYHYITLEPDMFVTLQPQDILKREYEWTEAGEYELITASEEAAENEMKTREMYQKAAEDEMKRRSEMGGTQSEDVGDHEGLFG